MLNIITKRYCSFFKSNSYAPLLLAAILISLHFISAYPGGMTADTYSQFTESLRLQFSSHHPPLMAMLWSLFNLIHQGPEFMLLFHLALLWGGVLLFFYSDTKNKYRFLYFILPLLPAILSQSAIIWKDVGFGFGALFVFGACAFCSYENRKMPVLLFIFLLLLCFYFVSIKFQAQFSAPILIFFLVSTYFRGGLLKKLAISTFLSVAIIYGNLAVINNLSKNTHSWQMRQIWDIATIAKKTNNEYLFPAYIREAPEFSFKKLQETDIVKKVDPLVYAKDTRIFITTGNLEDLKALNSAFFKAVLSHPIIYSTHRIKVFGYMMVFGSAKYKEYAVLEQPEELAKLGIDDKKFLFFKKIAKKYINIYPRFLSINIIYLLLIMAYAAHCIKNKGQQSAELNILKYIALFSIAHSLAMLFSAMATDYRYYFVVRTLSLFGLPIYLKSICSKPAMRAI